MGSYSYNCYFEFITQFLATKKILKIKCTRPDPLLARPTERGLAIVLRPDYFQNPSQSPPRSRVRSSESKETKDQTPQSNRNTAQFSPATMYGGDEVSAIVVDLGSHTCKAGYAGEDAPKAVFPSVIGSIDQMEVDELDNPYKNSGSVPDSKSKAKRKLYIGSQALGFRWDHVEVLSPIKDGIVADWEIVESIWDHAFKECLLIDPKEHPMLLVEPCANSQQQREK
ncbi:unnamed protein product [Coffea canephora]|uniref:Actin-related protein 4 n=1 Tax=Coffea canephora TaxID=49390 RepID=A0A068TR78_COFCA|nr:unnamed protein product [Coffea canephora]